MTSDLHLHRWSPELRRAVIAAQPDFFAWSPARQTAWRLQLPRADRQAIVASLLGPRAAVAPPGVEDRLSLPQQHRINELILPLTGVGADAFFLNEILPHGTTILDFGTVLAYDEDGHRFQERARAEDDPAYTPQPYLGSLHGCWARVLVGGRLVYLTLSMAAAWLRDEIAEAAAGELARRVPHRYVPGPDDGREEAGGIRWDRRLDAGGQETLVEEVQQRIWTYEQRRWRGLASEWDAFRRHGAYELDVSEAGETNLHLVFSDKEVLGDVRFETFLADCRRWRRPLDELRAAADAETARARAFVAEQIEDARRSSDPRVTTLRRRRKVLLHAGVLDDLFDGDED